jgi:hypothetical protein
MRREIPYLHVFGHALSKGCHGKLLCEMECAASSHSMLSQRSLGGKEEMRLTEVGTLWLATT